MEVQDLIELLKKFKPHAIVYVKKRRLVVGAKANDDDHPWAEDRVTLKTCKIAARQDSSDDDDDYDDDY